MMGIAQAYGGDQMKAVQAATRFMAQQGYNRKYQQNIQAGMSPQEAAADALAEYGPSLFFQPGSAVTPGNVASFIRATRPPAVKPPAQNVGAREIDLADIARNEKRIDALREAYDDSSDAGEKSRIFNDLLKLGKANADIRAKYNTPAAAPAPQQPQTRTAVSAPGVPAGSEQTGPNAGRVLVRRKDGKIGTVPTRRLQEYLKAGYTQVSNANP